MTSNLPAKIRFQLKDAVQGLSYPANTVEFVFEDDPQPVGADDGQTTLVLDMSKEGDKPVGVRSLSSELMVSGFKWDPDTPTATLTVEGVALDSPETAPVPSKPLSESSTMQHQWHQQHFSTLQRDAHHLSQRVALVRQALANLDTPP
ncbi:hypothetical protein GGF46_004451 [Coemansia sp. RSA 552]|nr:hypothetical protein GGF46_004451 [Coemansia sp. RSA 552]